MGQFKKSRMYRKGPRGGKPSTVESVPLVRKLLGSTLPLFGIDAATEPSAQVVAVYELGIDGKLTLLKKNP